MKKKNNWLFIPKIKKTQAEKDLIALKKERRPNFHILPKGGHRYISTKMSNGRAGDYDEK